MQNKFCKSLSNSLSFRIPGDSNTLTFNPCCLFNENYTFHPTIFNKKRSTWITTNEFLPQCSKCELKEKTHKTSLRLTSNQNIPEDIDDSIYKLEVVLDTTCNAACIQCDEYQSSLWRKQLELKDKQYFHIQKEDQIDSKIQLIKDSINLSEVKHFHFWGGEPLLTDTHLKFLKEVIDPSLVSIYYTTNGSIKPSDALLDIWKQYKLVNIIFSLDGLKDMFHYLRWPLTWDKVSENLLAFKELASENMTFSVNQCVMPLNCFYIDQLDKWLAENFHTTKFGRKIYKNVIRGESKLDLSFTPQELRLEVIKKLGPDHVVSVLLQELPIKDPQIMLDHLELWDPVRKLDWKEIFPDIVRYFKC